MDIPIPKDIPLAQPAPFLFLEILVVVSFLLHILFVALMVGGSIFTTLFQIRGLQKPEYDHLARWVASTITVNKSLAVVLGVAPLLIVNTLYTPYFYAANALTGTAWISVIPLVIIAFLLTYAHKYGWDRMANHRGLHISLSAGASILFLFVPLIFLANINLMLYPEHWGKVRGFLSTLLFPNVLPRYLHFLTASIAVTALFLVWYARRASSPYRETASGDRVEAQRLFYSLALAATTAQLFFGPLLYFTLPAHTISWEMTFVIIIGAALAVYLLLMLWKAARASAGDYGRMFWSIVSVLSLVVLLMGTGRHMIRETAIESHRQLVVERTQEYMDRVHGAQDFVVVPGGLGGEEVPLGEGVFRRVCAACHARDRRLVGPPLTEIATAYEGDPTGIVAWSRAPGRKRTDYPAMPPQNLPEEELRAVAEYILTPE